ncbi:uncharacterized protein BDZ99DRAFT_380226, partial [Mytilinidion resinicola]
MSAHPGSYQRYKEDTAAFASWLVQSAESCGFTVKLRTKSTDKPKGKARKRAKKDATTVYTFTTEELALQAEAIAKSGPEGVKVPHAILRKLRRAIDTRTRFTTWFATTGFDNGHSNERHAYFTERANKNVKKLSKPGPYEQITKAIFTTRPLKKGEDTTTQFHGKGTLEISKADELVYLPTARTIMKYRGSLSALYQCYPFPVISATDYYVDFPELLAYASVKQWVKEDEFLTQMLMDVHLMTYWDIVPED